jgi:RNA polymerase sigma factor (TIGR02999 family)
MAAPGTDEITGLLRAWSAGDEQALLQLTPVVYDELRRRSHRYMAREPAGHILQTTALVNEVYLRLVDLPQLTWQDRTHFFAVCARLMRQILTDLARARRYQKRGPGAIRVSLEEALPASEEPRVDLLALDEALNALARLDPRKAQVVERLDHVHGGNAGSNLLPGGVPGVPLIARPYQPPPTTFLPHLPPKP